MESKTKGGMHHVGGGKRSHTRQYMRAYDGTEVIVTLLEYPAHLKDKNSVDWDSFVKPSERGKHVGEYMKEMREGDRI